LTATAGPVAIVTDSTADVPDQEVNRLGIQVVPAVLTIDGQTYIDGVDISREAFYARMPQMREPATTAVPSPLAFEQTYSDLISQGFEHIVSIHVSSHLSGMLNAAARAASEFGEKIRCLDSLQISMGLGFQVLETAEAAVAGKSLERVLEVARTAREKVHVAALINTLEYLKRSGRVSWVSAELGELLNLKLLVGVRKGIVEQLARVRTSRKGYDALLQKALNWKPIRRLAILHSGIPNQAVEFVERVRNLSADSPFIVDVTTVIGAHVGPGSIGLAALSE
jgi:DegV family protein with EDD domain